MQGQLTTSRSGPQADWKLSLQKPSPLNSCGSSYCLARTQSSNCPPLVWLGLAACAGQVICFRPGHPPNYRGGLDARGRNGKMVAKETHGSGGVSETCRVWGVVRCVPGPCGSLDKSGSLLRNRCRWSRLSQRSRETPVSQKRRFRVTALADRWLHVTP